MIENKYKFFLAVLCLLSFVILTIVFLISIINYEEPKQKELPCYDEYGSEIIGETCFGYGNRMTTWNYIGIFGLLIFCASISCYSIVAFVEVYLKEETDIFGWDYKK
jgi:tellurite resistance protein TehA-like permease